MLGRLMGIQAQELNSVLSVRYKSHFMIIIKALANVNLANPKPSAQIFHLNHLQSQFEPWMEWSCWGRTRRNKDGKCWEVDHIIPRSTYQYTDIDTPEFKEIWNLKNLRPLARRDNLAKGITQ